MANQVPYSTINHFNISLTGEEKFLNEQFPASQFLQEAKTRSPDKLPMIEQTMRAIGCVINGMGADGSALFLGDGFILVNAHCVPNNVGRIFFSQLGQAIDAHTVVDGREHKLDYKILFTEQSLDLLSPNLSVANDSSQSLHMHHQSDGQMYITPYEPKTTGSFATRSAQFPFKTYPGDSGASQFSMYSQAVYAIHQGESEALKLNDIYQSLMEMQMNQDNWHLIYRAFQTLTNNTVDLPSLGMDFSPLALKEGDVTPENPNFTSQQLGEIAGLYPIPREVYNDIMDFLSTTLNSADSKRDFYARIWGPPGPLHNRSPLNTNAAPEGTRIERQAPLPNQRDATNIQFQHRGRTIATVLVSNQLAGRQTDHEIAEVVNYVILLFRCAINRAFHQQQAIQIRMDLRPRR